MYNRHIHWFLLVCCSTNDHLFSGFCLAQALLTVSLFFATGTIMASNKELINSLQPHRLLHPMLSLQPKLDSTLSR